MKSKLEIPILAIILSVIFVVAMFLSARCAWANPVYRYIDMPSDKITLFPDLPSTFQSNLTSYRISTLAPAGSDSIMNFTSSPSTNNEIAPFGKNLYLDANTFTFQRPVFAIGFTFLTTDHNSDIPDVTYEIRTYDKQERLIESVFASSWSKRIGGPRAFFIGSDATIGDFAASYAGVWTHSPIFSVSFGGVRPSDSTLMAAYGSFSFSETPPHGVPETNILLLFGSGLVGLIRLRKKFR